MVDIVVGQVAVPDVVALTRAAAETALSDQYIGFSYDAGEFSDSAAGIVLRQFPLADTEVDPGSIVVLTVSLGIQPSTLNPRRRISLREFLLGR